MAPSQDVTTSNLVNPLATADQLQASASRLDGVPVDLENSVRFAACRLIQAAGVLLRLPQELIAQSIVIFTRFWIGSGGGSLLVYDAQDIATASIYVVTKLSAHPQPPRDIITVWTYLSSLPSNFYSLITLKKSSISDTYFSESTYYAQRARLLKHEALILRTLGFQLHVALPYSLAINYLQALDVFGGKSGAALANRVFANLNSLLLSPQIVYLTHQPPVLATAAIYLSAKETNVKLPEDDWWEVFDTDREDLGFLMVAMTSMESFANEEKNKWGKQKVPLTAKDVENEFARQKTADTP